MQKQSLPRRECGGTHQERGDADELQLGALYLLKLKVPVDHVDRQVERLRHAAKLLVDLNLGSTNKEREKAC